MNFGIKLLKYFLLNSSNFRADLSVELNKRSKQKTDCDFVEKRMRKSKRFKKLTRRF